MKSNNKYIHILYIHYKYSTVHTIYYKYTTYIYTTVQYILYTFQHIPRNLNEATFLLQLPYELRTALRRE